MKHSRRVKEFIKKIQPGVEFELDEALKEVKKFATVNLMRQLRFLLILVLIPDMLIK